MKKILMLFIVLAIGKVSLAQDNTQMHHKMMTHHSMMKHKMTNCVYMENGKMMVMKNGKSMAMNKNMTMTNGTEVMTNGMVKMKNGKTMTMKNDECIYMNGKMSKMKNMAMNDK